MGRHAAQVFAREGASVVGCDLNVDAAQATVDTSFGPTKARWSSLQPCHLTKPGRLFRRSSIFAVRHVRGRIDVLFNNAAMAYFNWIERHHRRGVEPRSAGRGGSGVLPHPRGVAAAQSQPRRRRETRPSLNALLSFKTLGSLAHYDPPRRGSSAIDAAACDGGGANHGHFARIPSPLA